MIKYLNSLGYRVNNQPFAENSWYFRNALVRANYNNLSEGVAADPHFLEAFFRNLLLGEDNALKNRSMHLDWVEEQDDKPTIGYTEQVTRLARAGGRGAFGGRADAEARAEASSYILV